MAFGILQPPGDIHPPGTELLVSSEGTESVSQEEATVPLKRVTKKGVDTILIPQPSDDPNDPLLWPRWKKEAAFIVIFMNCIVFAATPGPVIAASTFALAGILNVTIAQVSQLSGYQLLIVGALGPIISVLAQKYGKRPQFLFASVMGCVGTIICICSKESYKTLLAGRIVQGLGVTAWESLSLAAIGDIFFLHERGWRTALLVLTLACMASTVSIISGVVTEHLGWRYVFIISLPFDVVGLLGTVFFLPETQFIRGEVPAVEKSNDSEGVKEQQVTVQQEVSGASEGEVGQTNGTTKHQPKQSYIQSLKPFSMTYNHENMLSLLWEIFVHLLNPAVWWILTVSAVLVSFFVGAAYISAQIWSVPPYNLNPAQNGYFFTGAFVGGLLAVGAGPVCDWSAWYLAKKNNGIFEAEFRIPINIIGAFFMGLGWFVFMWDVDHPTPTGYYLGSFCYGCACFGISVTSTAAGLYILDSFPTQSTPIFMLQMMVKNFLFYAYSTFVNDWAAEDGAGEIFKVFGIVSLVLMVTCIPMYVYGKWNREYVHRYGSRFGIH